MSRLQEWGKVLMRSQKVKFRKFWNCSQVPDICQALKNLLNNEGW